MKPRQQTLHRARGLRAGMTRPEVVLWLALRRDALGVKFRRQHPMGPYILDFYCEARRLAVEIDGAGHYVGDRPEHDRRRDAWLQAQGVTVLRIAARTVLQGDGAALAIIRAALEGEAGLRSAVDVDPG